MSSLAEKILDNIDASLAGLKDPRIADRYLNELVKFDPIKNDPKKEIYSDDVIADIVEIVSIRMGQHVAAAKAAASNPSTADEGTFAGLTDNTTASTQEAVDRDQKILDRLEPRIAHIAAKSKKATEPKKDASTTDTVPEMDLRKDTAVEMDMPKTQIGAVTASTPGASPDKATRSV